MNKTKVFILRDKCEILLEIIDDINNMRSELINTWNNSNNKENIKLSYEYMHLGEAMKMLRKQYNKYIDELTKLCKGEIGK